MTQKPEKTQRTILIATGNAGKLREIVAIASEMASSELNVAWKTLADLDPFPDVVEDGATFAENAAKKAIHFSRLSGLWTLADDSGLVVDTLNGAPGVRSARYAGEPCVDSANNTKLITALHGIPPEHRQARFHCAMALSDGERILLTSEGTIQGRIVDTPRGSNGFGYDPHFLATEFDMTTAEMLPDMKGRVSHRGQALRSMIPQLTALLRWKSPKHPRYPHH